MRLGRRGEAVKTMEEALRVLTEAAASLPWRPDLRLKMIRIHNELGTMLLGMGDARQALVEYRKALAIAQELLPQRPEDLVLRRDLADCYTRLGRYYEKLDRKQAPEWYKKARNIARL